MQTNLNLKINHYITSSRQLVNRIGEKILIFALSFSIAKKSPPNYGIKSIDAILPLCAKCSNSF
jgi:hypothetical protein